MGTRGPKPLPANVHMLRGNASKKSAAELREGVSPEVEIPHCPSHLMPEAKKEWKRISIELEQLGLISQMDRAALAVYCQAWARWVEAEKRIANLNGIDDDGNPTHRGLIDITPQGYKQISVWLQISNRAVETMHKFLAEFGMTPSARSRVTPGILQLALPGIEPAGKPTLASFAK